MLENIGLQQEFAQKVKQKQLAQQSHFQHQRQGYIGQDYFQINEDRDVLGKYDDVKEVMQNKKQQFFVDQDGNVQVNNGKSEK